MSFHSICSRAIHAGHATNFSQILKDSLAPPQLCGFSLVGLSMLPIPVGLVAYLELFGSSRCTRVWLAGMHDKLRLQTIAKFPQTLVVGFELEGICVWVQCQPRVGWKVLEAKGG